MLETVKKALRLTISAYDDELLQLIDAALYDLKLVGIPAQVLSDDPLIKQAVITYCKLHFGSMPDDADRLKSAYDEQKAQLMSASGYGLPED